MSERVCPECKKGLLSEKRGEYETVYVDRHGESHPLVVPDVTRFECANCHEVILDDQAMSAIEAARRGALGLLSPHEIRGLRARLGKTQAGMSDLLGIGEKTYCRWESGAYLQSEAFDRYLRLLGEEANVRLLEKIANVKSGQESFGLMAEEQQTFIYIRDFEIVSQQARPFVDLFSRGVLLAA
jgi:putative zinc finger/helix-turn-helix YgiT family protein